MDDKGQRRDVCWYCGGQLIWQNDFDLSDYMWGEEVEDEPGGMVTILLCSNCGAEVQYTVRDEGYYE